MDESWPGPARRWSLRQIDLPVAVGGSLMLVIAVLAILAPLISPHDPLAQVLSDRLKPPAWLPGGSPTYLLGTDAVGRDLLSRILWGARTSLEIG
ncbi:MAG: ABC transporter permease, partial [Candidatus Limnocylindrales bacterium]